MKKSVKDQPFAKRRFDWKRTVWKDPNLGRGTKVLATYLCDKHVNSQHGCCWPMNRTVARALSYSIRTVQRHYRILENAGYLEVVTEPGVRRKHRIALPDAWEDTKPDNLSCSKVTTLPVKDVTAVIPYENQLKNKKEGGSGHDGHFAFIEVGEGETSILLAWKDWIGRHRSESPEQVIEWLRKGRKHHFPCRYPKPGEMQRYHQYFDRVLKAGGWRDLG